ncbi:MAG: hypothetical protein ACKOCM_08620 [Cyanobacteriota bacterium]
MRRPSQLTALALLVGSPLISILSGSAITPVRADYAYGYSKVEQQFIDQGGGGKGTGKGDSILDSTNPIDLMNKLRRGAAMEEATPPKDSIDAALRELEQLTKPQTATTAGVTGTQTTPDGSRAVSPHLAPALKP